jgi:hypothetical protein
VPCAPVSPDTQHGELNGPQFVVSAMADDKPQLPENEVLRQHQRVLIDLCRSD